MFPKYVLYIFLLLPVAKQWYFSSAMQFSYTLLFLQICFMGKQLKDIVRNVITVIRSKVPNG